MLIVHLRSRIPITVVKPLTVEPAPADGVSSNGDAEPQNDFIARLGWQSLVPGALQAIAVQLQRELASAGAPSYHEGAAGLCSM